jgi:hypothetical protein
VTNCVFIGNWSSNQSGGGINNFDSGAIVVNCTFIENYSGIGGGGIRNGRQNNTPIIINCTFEKNSSDGYHGGGAICNYDCDSTVTNCTFVKNTGKYTGGICNRISNPTITNCILWDNDGEIYNYDCTPIISYCDIKGGYPGTGNIDADPLFVDEVNGDFHLTYTSPCKDTGDNAAITELTDFEGDMRIAYDTVDMGADEFYTHLYYTGHATPGGEVQIKFVGVPNTLPLALCAGTGVLDNSIPTKWGEWWNEWWLKFPIIGPFDFGSIPSPDGVYIFPTTLPPDIPGPYSIPLQAFIGDSLTNLSVMEVE